jgi:hypothetical protein
VIDQNAIVGAPAGVAIAKMENLGSGAVAANRLLRRPMGGSILPFVRQKRIDRPAGPVADWTAGRTGIFHKGGCTVKAMWTLLLSAVVLGCLALSAKAAEETKTGTLTCGKCTLKETDACSNVLQVKEGDKTVNYYIKDKGKTEDYHGKVCPANTKKEATVTGTIEEKDGKKWITNAKVEFK